MDPQRPNKILDEWDSVSAAARPPDAPPRGVVVRSNLAGPGLLGGALLIAGLVLAVVWLGRPDSNGSVGAVASATPSASENATVEPPATPIATESATPAPSATPAGTASPAPTPTPVTAIGPCEQAKLAVQVTGWEGAAGSRIATVMLKNAGPETCTIRALSRPQLVDRAGSVLIDGSKPAASKALTLAAGDNVTTLVDVSNYCGSAPIGYVTVAFELGDGSGRVVASPPAPDDALVPPCNGGSGSAGNIAMHPWAK